MTLNAHQEAALRLARRGFLVLPAWRAHELGGGKVPLAKEWQNSPRLSDFEIEDAWSGANPYNISVLTGAPSGIFVLDIDPGAGGGETMTALVQQHGPLPATYVVQTGSGGWHYYFQMPDFDLRNSAGKIGPGIDTRGNGGQVIAAGSTSAKGPYREMNDAAIAAAPDWLLEALRPKEVAPTLPQAPIDLSSAPGYEKRAVEENIARLRAMAQAATSTPGAYRGEPWDHTVFAVACRLTELANAAWSTMTHEAVQALLLEHSPRDAGFDEARILAKVTSARGAVGTKQAPPPRGRIDDSSLFEGFLEQQRSWESERPPWGKHSWDDFGNAERVIAMFGERLRWVHELGIWMEYDGRCWVDSPLGGERAALRAIEALRELEEPLYSDAVDPDDARKEPKSQKENFRAWAKLQRTDARTKAAASLVRTTGHLDATSSDFDQNPDVLNVGNGVVDLLSGALMPHEASQMLRRVLPTEYDPAAVAPNWERFLERVMPDLEMRNYLQRVVGYSITGRTDDQVIFLHHGVTANGKSVFLRVIDALLGDLAQVVPPKTLLVKREDQHPTDIDRMEGKRWLSLAETPRGARLDEALVKRLTGEDTITARGMGKDFREFRITGKVHVVTNHLPHVENDPATVRRLRLIEWGVTIPEAERDAGLARRIIATELSGVLAWAVRGAAEWKQHGLAAPVAAIIDTETFVASEDTLGQWMEDCQVVTKDGHFVSNAEIYLSYKAWCLGNGVEPMAITTLGKELLRRGFREMRMPGSGARGKQLAYQSLFTV